MYLQSANISVAPLHALHSNMLGGPGEAWVITNYGDFCGDGGCS